MNFGDAHIVLISDQGMLNSYGFNEISFAALDDIFMLFVASGRAVEDGDVELARSGENILYGQKWKDAYFGLVDGFDEEA